MTLLEKIESLPACTLPKQYGWKDREGVDLRDLGFTHTCDCLNKGYTRECDPFPQDFDAMLLYRILGGHLKYKWVHKFISVKPENIILGQRYVKKNRLKELAEEPNREPVRGVQVGKYVIIHDGHHRLAIKSLRGAKLYAKLKTFYYE